MRQTKIRHKGFTLLELLMAMGLFAIAAISLAQAINLISLSVAESIDEAEIREQLRGVLIESSKDPNLEAGSRTIQTEQGITFQIDIERLDLSNREANTLEDIYKVLVTARQEVGGQQSQEVAVADTWVYRNLYRKVP